MRMGSTSPHLPNKRLEKRKGERIAVSEKRERACKIDDLQPPDEKFNSITSLTIHIMSAPINYCPPQTPL